MDGGGLLSAMLSELEEGDDDSLLIHDDTATARVTRASLNEKLDGLERLSKESSFREATGENENEHDVSWAYGLTPPPAENKGARIIGATEERGSGTQKVAEERAAEVITVGATAAAALAPDTAPPPTEERAAEVIAVGATAAAARAPDIAPPRTTLAEKELLSTYESKFAEQNRVIRALTETVEERDCTIAALTAAAASNRDGGDSVTPRGLRQKSSSMTESRSMSFVLPTTAAPMQKEEGERLWLRTEAKIREQQTRLNITVAVRVRPFTQREIALQTANCIGRVTPILTPYESTSFQRYSFRSLARSQRCILRRRIITSAGQRTRRDCPRDPRRSDLIIVLIPSTRAPQILQTRSTSSIA